MKTAAVMFFITILIKKRIRREVFVEIITLFASFYFELHITILAE